jgi:hypothetical protein
MFHFSTASKSALRPAQPPIQWIPEILSLGVMRLGDEADHSLPSSSEINNTQIYTSIPPCV